MLSRLWIQLFETKEPVLVIQSLDEVPLKSLAKHHLASSDDTPPSCIGVEDFALPSFEALVKSLPVSELRDALILLVKLLI